MDPDRLAELKRRQKLTKQDPEEQIDESQEDMCLTEWEAMDSYAASIRFKRLFINRQRQLTPYHLGPLEPESQTFVSELLDFHDFRLLTQPFMDKGSEYIKTEVGDWWYHTRQRPYNSFVIPQKDRIPSR